MLKKIILLFAGVFFLPVFCAEKYAHPALNPVTFHKAPAGKSLPLIVNGKINFAIVCDLSAEQGQTAEKNFVRKYRRSVTLGLEGLQHALKSTTGRKAVVLKPDSPQIKNYKYLIVLGDNALSRKLGFDVKKLSPEEFRVFTFDKGVVIAGFDGSTQKSYDKFDASRYRINGTSHGVYDFNERFLGMRYYYPKMGIYAPEVKNLVIEPVSYSDKPQIKYHFSYALTGKRIPGKAQLSDFSPAWRNGTSSRYISSHTPRPRPLAAAYPDKINMFFFRNRAGHLFYNPHAHIGNFFDITNPEFSDFFVNELAVKFYAGDKRMPAIWGSATPNSEYIPFGQADTYVGDLVNERSKNLLPESTRTLRHGSQSDLYAHFNIELAKKIKKRFPGKNLATSVYSARTLPPVGKFNWPDNLHLKLCMGCPVMAKNAAFRKAWKKVASDWHKITGRPVGGYSYGVPVYAITHALEGRYMKDFIDLLGDDLWEEHLFFDAGGHNNQYYYSYYQAYRAIWNKNFNVTAAIDEHWELLYGKAAGKLLKEFYDLLIDRWEKRLVPSITNVSLDYSIRGSVTPKELYKAYDLATIDKLSSLLEKAKKAVRKGSIEEKRLLYFAGPWKNQFDTARAYHTTSIPIYKVKFLEKGEKITLDGNGNDPAWKRAPFMKMSDSSGVKRVYKENPRAKMMWDKKGIYLFFTSDGRAVDNPGEIWKKSDALEYFLSPGLKKTVFYQIAFNPTGKLYQGTKDLIDGVSGSLAVKGMVVKSVNTDKNWQAEVFIPFAGIKAKTPAPYEVWFGNVVYAQRRTESSSGNISASFAFTMRNTHNVDLWGQFKFMGIGD